MKYTISSSTLLLLTLLFLNGNIYGQVSNPKKVGLIISISKYARHNYEDMNWRNLPGAARDVEIIESALMAKGFKSKDILKLRDEEATKKGIEKMLNETLLDQVEEGSICIIQFSGHGQRMFDSNGDELDGLDEAIIPYDAMATYRKGIYTGENHLSDDEFNQSLIKLREKIGETGKVLVILDSCYSGTGLRNNSVTRGSEIVMASQDYINDLGSIKINSNQLMGLNSSADGLADLVAIYGSSFDEPNSETKGDSNKKVGSLSYAFAKCFTRAYSNQTYQELFDQIRYIMLKKVPSQTPSIEGSITSKILGGNIDDYVPSIKIADWVNKQVIKINEGTLTDIHPGTKIGIYPGNVFNPEGNYPIIIGKVLSAEPTSSVVELDSALNREIVMTSRLYIEEESPIISASVEFKNLNQKETAFLNSKLDKSPFLNRVDKEGDIKIMKINKLYSTQNFLTGESIVKTESIDSLWQGLINFQLAKRVLNLNTKEEIFEASIDYKYLGNYDSNTKRIVNLEHNHGFQNGIIIAGSGDVFDIEIKNNSDRKIYFCLVAIFPDNTIQPLFPYFNRDLKKYSNLKPNEAILNPQASIKDSFLFDIKNGIGNEVHKLITSDSPIDLKRYVLIQNQNKKDTYTRGNDSVGILDYLIEDIGSDLPVEVTRSQPFNNPNKINVETAIVKLISDQ